jgi:hypothetical protein
VGVSDMRIPSVNVVGDLLVVTTYNRSDAAATLRPSEFVKPPDVGGRPS